MAVLSGVDFQARWFWLQACRLLAGSNCIEQVGFEIEEFGSFDDVVIHYNKDIPDSAIQYKNAEYHQLKFHLRNQSAFTWKSLIDPSFIGATSVSLLQKLKLAVEKSRAENRKLVFRLISFGIIDPNDPLFQMIDNIDGRIRFSFLSQGKTTKSKAGKVRLALKKHLGYSSDEDLFNLLAHLRIEIRQDQLERFQSDILNPNLTIAGLKPISPSHSFSAYDSLIWNLYRQGKRLFNRNSLLEVCKTNSLVQNEVGLRVSNCKSLGIRSFFNWAQYIEDYVDPVLDLLEFFEQRKVKDSRYWEVKIKPRIQAYLRENLKTGNSCQLFLETHTCIAFFAGTILNCQSGVTTTLIRKNLTGAIESWVPPANMQTVRSACWNYSLIKKHVAGNCHGLAISVSNDIELAVAEFFASNYPNSGLLHCKINPIPSQYSVKDSEHAIILATELVAEIRKIKNSLRIDEFPIFVSAPNSLMFYLGQLARNLGTLKFYEYSSQSSLASYIPSMIIDT